ncbi:hypothetical protein BJ165DRAFT_1464207 [Panaeolus papilionaceus]|nr:hypothetical protein BJ165DRAFT_1464207 [Panaeolus papilionaceus]
MSLLDNATHVVNFTIQNVPSGANDSLVNTANRSPPRLQPTMFTLYNPPLHSTVLSSEYCDLTSVLTFRIYAFELPLRAILGYLARFSSTLTRLEIYLTTYQTYYSPGDPQPLILSALFNLRHLTLTLNAKFKYGQLTSHSASDFQWIINTLCSLSRSNIVESIRILTRINTLDYLRSIDWALFDSSVFGLEPPTKWVSLKALDMMFFMNGKHDLTPLVIEFQDVWIPGTLLNFRGKTHAVLDVRCRTGQSIMDYAPGDLFLL